MTSSRKARTAFFCAIVVLLLCGIAVFVSVLRLLDSERWVTHTHLIQSTFGEFDAAVSAAARARTTYILGGDDESLRIFDEALPAITRQLATLKQMTQDNPKQQALCAELESVTRKRIALFQQSIELKQQGLLDKERQDALLREQLPLSSSSTALVAQMRDQEQKLLRTRTQASQRLFVITISILAVSFVFALVLFGVHFRLLAAELKARELAEQEARTRNAQLEAANRELDTFSYSVSHDLRAPLRSIDGFSLALIEDCHDQLSAQGRDHLARIRVATARMQQLIEDLLGLAHTSRREMQPETVNLSAVAEDVAAQLKKLEPGREVAFSADPGLVVQGDRGLLRIVLENLLGNAWKFTSKKPDARVEFGQQKNGGRNVFFVRDNGAGFEMKYASRLFGPFQRLHGQNEFSGTGIGLATVQRIIHRHGGKIWAESAPEQGASFFFFLDSQSADGARGD